MSSGLQGDRAMRVKVAFGQYSVGAVIYPTAAYREWLVRSGFIEDADQQPSGLRIGPVVLKRPRGRPRKEASNGKL